MTTAIKNGPYEILLRFNCERGEAFGHLRGCHRVMSSYVVDDAGTIVGRVDTGETAADFPQSELVSYLGDQFATFSSQLETAAAEASELRASLAKATLDLASANAELQSLRASSQRRSG